MNNTLLLFESSFLISGIYFEKELLIVIWVFLLLANPFFSRKLDWIIKKIFDKNSSFTYIFSTAFYHRFLIAMAMFYLAWSDFYRFDADEFGSPAIK